MAGRKGRPSRKSARKSARKLARRLRRDALGRWLELRTRPPARRSR